MVLYTMSIWYVMSVVCMIWCNMVCHGYGMVSTVYDITKTIFHPTEATVDENFGGMEDISGGNSPELGDNTKRRDWTPLQLKNPEYLESLKNRENTNRDFIMENIVSDNRIEF